MSPPTLRSPTLGRAFAWLLGISAAATLAACDITAPLPNGAQPLDPLANYSAWWSMMESCSGHSKPMRSVEWFTVPGRSFVTPGGQQVNGLHQEGRITIAGDFTRDGRVVRHEMLHAIVGRVNGIVHPAEYFITKCGGFVTCNQGCLETSDGPPQPPPGTPTVSSNALEIHVDVDSIVSLSSFIGVPYTSILVSARNPLNHDVVIAVPQSSYTQSFAMSLVPPTAQWAPRRNAIPYGSHETFFRAGQTKTYLFDVYLDIPNAIGDWTVEGGFGTKWVTETVKFRVTR